MFASLNASVSTSMSEPCMNITIMMMTINMMVIKIIMVVIGPSFACTD